MNAFNSSESSRVKSDRPKSDGTRSRILETALRLFRDKGFESTSMREIASEAGAATGAAYYYFASKEALVTAFYQQAQEEMEPLISSALAKSKSVEGRLRAIIRVKFLYFAPNRPFLGALNRHAADPQHPLSPFSKETQAIRDRDIRFFAEAIETVRHIPADLKPELPTILWAYQMALILFWIHDRSPEQKRTAKLLDASLPMVTGLIGLANLPFTRPLRKRVVGLMRILSSQYE